MRQVLFIFILAIACLAQTEVTSTTHIANHGGYPLYANVGTSQGDTITLHVTCNNHQDSCFAQIPVLLNGQYFKLIRQSGTQDQTWQVVAGNTADQFVFAVYYPGSANYDITIVARHKT